MVTRPGMWASSGQAFDWMAKGLLADLCFLDEREADRDAVEMELRAYGKLGVAGPFIAMFGEDRSCVVDALRNAEPEDKLDLYRALGLRLTYDPAKRTVRAIVDLGTHRWDLVRVRGGT
jgi:hypothetical protein